MVTRGALPTSKDHIATHSNPNGRATAGYAPESLSMSAAGLSFFPCRLGAKSTAHLLARYPTLRSHTSTRALDQLDELGISAERHCLQIRVLHRHEATPSGPLHSSTLQPKRLRHRR